MIWNFGGTKKMFLHFRCRKHLFRGMNRFYMAYYIYIHIYNMCIYICIYIYLLCHMFPLYSGSDDVFRWFRTHILGFFPISRPVRPRLCSRCPGTWSNPRCQRTPAGLAVVGNGGVSETPFFAKKKYQIFGVNFRRNDLGLGWNHGRYRTIKSKIFNV